MINPKVLREVKPAYTAEALHAGIEGTVVVECVVLADGTVGDVRVLKSLDSVYGLDEQALKAAKQWRFQPGTKDGVAVPALIAIEMSFSHTVKPQAVPFSTPSLFESVPSAKSFRENVMWVADPAPDWPSAEGDAPGIHFRFLYPPDWSVREDASSPQWFIVQSNDGSRTLVVSQLQPRTWPQSTTGGATQSELQKVRDDLQRRLSAMRSRARVQANGWMPLLRICVWHEVRVPAGDPSIPSAVSPDPSRFDGARWWQFIWNMGSRTQPSTQQITVDCFLMRQRGASNAEADEEIRQAGPQFLTMLRRMSIELR